ncbi:radical SAM protein [Candidatus Pacearchaeota archaeon]|jgi:DNA repair photolyase|nr:radical SAM protein [Candidatus Pacearchaeota archaeon]
MPKIEDTEASGYRYFMSDEPRENLGPILVEDDSILGKVKVREARIGMVRNASDANRKAVKVYLNPLPHVRIENAKPLQGWYKSKHEPGSIRPRPCYTEALLTEPYGGSCPIRCRFCYVNSGVRGYRGTGLTVVPFKYGEQIKKQLSQLRRGSAGYITPFHEPFNPLEKFYHNTQQAAEAFTEVGLPIFFLSRLNYPDWAIELLKQNKYSYAQKSINTSDPSDWKKLSPGAPPLDQQYADIRRISDSRIYVSIQVNSVIPGVTSNEQVVELFRQLANAGANHVIVKFVECAYSWVSAMVARMVESFGDRGNKFAELLTQNIGGEKTIDEGYRRKAHALFRREATKLGLTYAMCYEYGWDCDDDGKVLSKTGVSLGPTYTTSDQCHGRRVPVFTRNSAEERFKEIKVCPPSGCLYCADDNNGVPRCKDQLMGEATALRLPAMKKPIQIPEKK